MPDSYVLDGKEVDFTIKSPGGQTGIDMTVDGPNGKQLLKRTFTRK